MQTQQLITDLMSEYQDAARKNRGEATRTADSARHRAAEAIEAVEVTLHTLDHGQLEHAQADASQATSRAELAAAQAKTVQRHASRASEAFTQATLVVLGNEDAGLQPTLDAIQADAVTAMHVANLTATLTEAATTATKLAERLVGR